MFFSCSKQNKVEVINQADSLLKLSQEKELTNSDTSYYYAEEAYIISEANNLKKQKAKALIMYAKRRANENKYYECLKNVQIAIEIAEEEKDTAILFLAYSEKIRIIKFLGLESEKFIEKMPDIEYEKFHTDTLMKNEVAIQHIFNQSVWENNKTDSDIILKIRRIIKQSLQHEKEFIARHNLAKAYYALAEIYTKLEPENTDSIIKNYQRSIYYDKLLNNRQAWSIFTLAEYYLILYKQNKNIEMLDSAWKYNNIALTNLQNFHHIYPYQHKKIYENFCAYYLLKAGINNTKENINLAINYNKKIDSIQYSVYNKNVEYHINYANSIDKHNKDLKKQKFVIYVILSISITILIVIFIIFLLLTRKKQKKLIRKNIRLDNEMLLRKETLNKLEISNKQRDDALISNRIIYSNIAHEISNLFKPVLDKSEILSTKYSGEIKNNFISIYESLINIDIHFRELHTWTKSQSNSIYCDKRSLTLKILLKNVIKLIKPNIKDKNNIILIDDVAENLNFFGDKTMVASIFKNIIINALKYTYPKDKIIIKANKTDEYVQITIQDNGKGMSEEQMKNAFIPKKDKGVGLIISKYFIDLHNGKIKFESEIKKYTKVTILIPNNK